MIDPERLAAYEAILRQPPDPVVKKQRLRSRITAPVLRGEKTRIRQYHALATAWLMHRDLDRDGDLD